MGLTITIDQKGCARCHGDGHKALKFTKLTFPVELPGATTSATFWAPCPTNGQPILMAIEVAP